MAPRACTGVQGEPLLMGVDSRTAIFRATSQPGAALAWGVQEDQQMVIWNHIQRMESSRRRGSQLKAF